MYELRLNEETCSLDIYLDGFYVNGFALNRLATSEDVLHAVWEMADQPFYSPALVGSVLRSLRTLLVSRNAEMPWSTRWGFKPRMSSWTGTRVNNSSSSKAVNQ